MAVITVKQLIENAHKALALVAGALKKLACAQTETEIPEILVNARAAVKSLSGVLRAIAKGLKAALANITDEATRGEIVRLIAELEAEADNLDAAATEEYTPSSPGGSAP